MDVAELHQWCGTLFLLTRVQLANRHDAWATTSHSKFLPPLCFGNFTMSRNRFNQIWKCKRWSYQPSERRDGQCSEEYRWMLVQDFVKRFNSHEDFPWKHLNGIQFENRGQHYGMFHKACSPGLPDLLAFAWVDRDQRYFISTCSNLREAEPIFRERWRQVEEVSSQEDPEHVTMEIPLPSAAKLYYDNCGRIDQHNRKRQDDLRLEKKLGTRDWSKRVNLSIMGMITVDAYLAYIGCTQPAAEQDNRETFNEFIHKLADEMIEWGKTMRHQRAQYIMLNETPPSRRKRAGSNVVHLTPSLRTKPRLDPKSPVPKVHGNSRTSGYCRVCKSARTVWLCSHCNKEVPLCHYKEGKDCWETHCQEHHEFEAVLLPTRSH